MSCDLYLVAGEKSGDLHAEKLVHALKRRQPELTIAGVAGPHMRSAGVTCTLPMETLQVMGFVDVFFALPKLMRQFYRVLAEIERLNPKAVVTIDYPGFNLRLAKHLKRRGFQGKLIHFISPSVWAWGKKRIPQMAQTLDHLLTILPFEKALFAHTDLEVTYVGHPLIERIATHEAQPLELPKDKRIIPLFPGSRQKEIERNLPLYLRVAQQLVETHKDLHFVVSISHEKFRPLVVGILEKMCGLQKEHLSLASSAHSYDLMHSASMAIAKSGTVTLELALHRVPTVVTYAISPLDVFIARDILKIRLPHYCLVNIIAGKEIFPELFGPHFTETTLLRQAERLLEPTTQTGIQHQCDTLIAQLGTEKSSETAAQTILQTTHSWTN